MQAASSRPVESESSSLLVIPFTDVTVVQRQTVEDALGEIWTGRYLGQDVDIHRLQVLDEDKFHELCTECAFVKSTLDHPYLVPICAISKETPNPGTVLLLSKHYGPTLEQLLRQQKKNPPLDVKLTWARQVLQALRFLHQAQRDYTHGTVTIRNVQVDEKTESVRLSCYAFTNYQNKKNTIADFYAKPPEVLKMELRRGEDNSTPLNQSPQADIYSFGILLWELCTGRAPFPQHKTLASLVHEVCETEERPPLNGVGGEGVASIIRDCWSFLPEKRPSFDEIDQRLAKVLLDVSGLEDSLARQFWKENFIDKRGVPWPEFQVNFYSFLELPPPKKLNDIRYICLHSIVKELHDDHKEIITLKIFSDMLNWFGPLHKGSSFLDRIYDLLSKPWFFGKLSGKEAEGLVTEAGAGSFVFRFSASEPGSYAITVNTRRSGLKHYRVYHKPGLNYLVGTSECKSLDEIIFKYSNQLGLGKPCPGSQFQSLFKQDNFLKQKYEAMYPENEDEDGWGN